MKKTVLLFLALSTLFACDNDDDSTPTIVEIVESDVSINFTQSFDGVPVTSSEFNDITYTNANGEELSISRLRYLMSDIVLTAANGIEIEISEFNLVDVGERSGTTINAPVAFTPGDYTLSMRFGFSNADNIGGIYPDLNVANWSTPALVGDGYHYMQMEGMYINSEGNNFNYQYHTIRAVEDPGTNPTTFTDTSILVNLGTITIEGSATSIEVDMNIAEWYKNPNQWDLNELFTVLMPNFDAQIMMNENGQNVFSLGTVTNIQE